MPSPNSIEQGKRKNDNLLTKGRNEIMYILSNITQKSVGISTYLPPSLRQLFDSVNRDGLLELRIGRKRPIVLCFINSKAYLSKNGGTTSIRENAYIATKDDMASMLEKIFDHSLYAHEDEFSNGFVTLKGGHRVGLCGEVKSGRIRTLSDITSVNIRLAGEHKGIAEPLKDKLIKGTRVMNTLIISPPMCGKTTLLRDIIRMLSSVGIKVGVCDTRGELAAISDGVAYMDIGDADVLSGAKKAAGIEMLLRTMSPEVIVCDELSGARDINAVREAAGCGCSIIASAHAENVDELYKKQHMRSLAREFDIIITLRGVGEICEVRNA